MGRYCPYFLRMFHIKSLQVKDGFAVSLLSWKGIHVNIFPGSDQKNSTVKVIHQWKLFLVKRIIQRRALVGNDTHVVAGTEWPKSKQACFRITTQNLSRLKKESDDDCRFSECTVVLVIFSWSKNPNSSNVVWLKWNASDLFYDL